MAEIFVIIVIIISCHYSTLIFRLRDDAYHIIYLLTYNNNEVVPLDRIIIGRQ